MTTIKIGRQRDLSKSVTVINTSGKSNTQISFNDQFDDSTRNIYINDEATSSNLLAELTALSMELEKRGQHYTEDLAAVNNAKEAYINNDISGFEKWLQHSKDKIFAGSTTTFESPTGFSCFLDQLYAKPWVVYAKHPFAGPKQVIRYLGRYTHRVAIGNQRLLSIDDNQVKFRYKDYADQGRNKTLILSAEEFLRHFLLHILPYAFMRLRHYGLLANRYRKQKLARCRELLHQPDPPMRKKEDAKELIQRLAGIDISLCPTCHQGHLHIVATLAPSPNATGPPSSRR